MRLLASLVVMAVMLAGAGVPSASASARTASKATSIRGFDLPMTIQAGTVVRDRARVSGPTGRRILLQHKRPGGTWQTVARARVRNDHRVAVRVGVARAASKWRWSANLNGGPLKAVGRTKSGIHDFRLVAKRSGRHARAVSAERVRVSGPRARSVAPPNTQSLIAVTQAQVFFGHQSVGGNVLAGIPALYRQHSLSPPRTVETTAMRGTGGLFAHARIGRNKDPEAKIRHFDAILRGGVGRTADVVVMKFCYVDITRTTDVSALFARYQAALAALERTYPDVTFIHATVPLRMDSSHAEAEDNVARTRYNALVRQTYGSTGRVFDLARVESTAPNGTRVVGHVAGNRYESLYSGYSSDGGHLNYAGSVAAAEELVRTIAGTL